MIRAEPAEWKMLETMLQCAGGGRFAVMALFRTQQMATAPTKAMVVFLPAQEATS
jgi:hypothetical protein